MNTLPIYEIFYSIQGEGAHAGKAAVFIRLSGCDVGCFWCDIKESWPVEKKQWLSEEEILKTVAAFGGENVVITGGEPAMYDLSSLSMALKERGYQTWIETSGAYAVSGFWDWVCVSPKKFKEPLSTWLDIADELKVIVYNQNDFKWAEHMASKVSENCRLFLQSEWSKRLDNYPEIVAYIKAHPKWAISLQSQNILEIP